jgi:hypothetical protein
MYEDEVRRVQCVVCGEVHAYRKPRGDGAEDGGEGGKKHGPRRVTWDEAMSRATDNDLANCRPYSIRDTYEEGDVVHHPVFDIGFVVVQLPDNKVEVIFRDGGARILVHNRGDLASRMPDIAEVPAPREAKKKKRAKKAEAPAAPVPQRSKAEVEAAVVRAVTARFAVGVNLSANDALHAPDFVLVHADDGVGRIGLAAGRRAGRRELTTDLIGFFFEDGVHPRLFGRHGQVTMRILSQSIRPDWCDPTACQLT